MNHKYKQLLFSITSLASVTSLVVFNTYLIFELVPYNTFLYWVGPFYLTICILVVRSRKLSKLNVGYRESTNVS